MTYGYGHVFSWPPMNCCEFWV